MKKISKRLLTMLLSAAMVFGLSGMTAFAAEADGQDAQAPSSQGGIVTLADDSNYKRPAIDSEPDGTYREYDRNFDWYKELGSEADTYVINSREELAAFSDIVNGTDLPEGISQNSFEGQTVTLGKDIEMNDADDVWSEDGEWGGTATPTLHVSENAYAFTPIGNMKFNPNGSVASGNSFEGTFDGKGHKITNLFVFSGLEEDGYDGLFGVVGSYNYAEEEEAGTIVGHLTDFTVTGLVWVRGGYYGEEIDFVGGVCARLTAGAKIDDVTNQARIYAPYTDNVGGIVGFAGTPHAMGGSSETGGGTDTDDPGYEDNPSGYNTFVERCANEAPVSAFHKNGGIVGENAATVKYCYNTGWVQCRRNYAGIRMGGIVGANGNNGYACEESVVAYCYNAGPISNNGRDDLYYAAVSGVRGYAGIVGSNYGGDGKNEIYNCYNIGAIPAGYENYNAVASYLDGDTNYGYGAYVSIRNNYSLISPYINSYPESGVWEIGYQREEDEFLKTSYGDDDILTCLGPAFVEDTEGLNKKAGFPILWWQADKDAELPALKGLTIAKEPTKTTGYSRGDTFDPTGMVVIAEYEDGTRALLTPDIDSYNNYWYTRTDGYHYQYEVNSGEYMDGTGTYVEISYTDGDKTVYAWQPVNGAKPSLNGVEITSDLEDNTKTYDGEEVTLTADVDVEPGDADQTYQWYQGDEEITGATEKEYILEGNVSDSGTYKCVVTASYDGEQLGSVSGEITIEITQAEQELSFASEEITKMEGDEPFVNELSGVADGATVTYSSSADSIASVDENGLVTIHAMGEVTITADVSGTENYKEAQASYKLTIEEPQAPTIGGVTITSDLDDNTKTYDGAGVTLTAEAQDVSPTGTNLTYQWYTVAEDGTETEIDGETGSVLDLPGDVSDTGTYKCIVTAANSAGSVSAEGTITITITKAKQEISYEETIFDKKVGDDAFTNPLTETTVDTDGGAVISYKSSDETIATVDENGLVTILAEGDVTITATVSATANYEEASASYFVAIEASPEPTVDKTVLKAAIDTAEGLDESNYTKDSWSVLENALAAANAVYEDDNATQDDVKDAEMELIEAIAQLKDAGGGQTPNTADKETLLDEYEKGMNLTESDYTPESWGPFADALANAQEVLLDVNATQADVDKAAEALKTAMDNLKKPDSGNVKNGLLKGDDGKWGYYVNSKVDTSYTGFASNSYGDWYVVNGYVLFDQNTVAKDKTGKNGDKGVGAAGTWYYVVGSQVQHNFTGLAHYKNANGWWYITKGEVDFTHNGVDKNQNGWWYVKNGKVEFGHNGVDKNQNGWWYITGGKVQFGYTGVANYKNANGWWYIKEGKVDFTHNGVEKNKYGWWYVSGGKVNFNFNGRASNRYGTWNIVNGKVVF